MELKSIVESLIFAAPKPLTVQQLRSLTGTPNRQLKEVLGELQQKYNDSGLQLVEAGGGFHFRTHPECADWVRKLLAGRPQRLTRPMLETLAIVAYQQPITRPEIEEIRGVDCGGTLRVLLERNLIRILGKKEEPGRPLLYGTAKFFLEFFQLSSLKDLPTLKEFAELSEEHAEQVEFFFGNRPRDAGGATGPSAAVESDATAASSARQLFEAIEGPLPADQQEQLLAALEAETLARVEAEAAAARAAAQAAAQQAHETAANHGDEQGDDAADESVVSDEELAAIAARERELEEEDEAVMAALDRAMERAGSVLDEVSPPKPRAPRSFPGAKDTEAPATAEATAQQVPPPQEGGAEPAPVNAQEPESA